MMSDNTAILMTAAAIVAGSVLLLRWCFESKSKMMNIPGNNGQWPIIGDTMMLLNPRTMASYQVSCRRQWNSPVWRTSVLFKRCIFVSGNSNMKLLAKEEMTKRNTQACFPPHHKALFGENSILVISGEIHDKIRKVIVPLLQPSLYKEEIEKAAASFVEDCLSTQSVQSEYIPLVPKLKQFTLSVALRIAVGENWWQDWTSPNTNKPQLSTLLDDFAIWSIGLLSAPTASVPFTPAHRAMRARRRIKAILENVINKEKQALLDDSRDNGKVRDSLIVLLLKESKKENSCITDDVIVDNILTFLFAGHETTASILTSSFYKLSSDNALRERLKSCANNVADNGSDELLAFISEVQRMYPAAPFTMREVVSERIFMGSDFGTIPPGYLVTYSIAETLLDDETSYPNPEVFDLDRWLGNRATSMTSKPPVCAFGGGSRICPGRFLANAECISLLRLVLSHNEGFEWTLKDGQDLNFTYNPGFFPADGLLCKISQE